MPFDLTDFQDPALDADLLEHLLDHQAPQNRSHFTRLWNYCRNPLVPATGPASGSLNENSRPYFLAQEVGLPARITGIQREGSAERLTDLRRKEVVIENDIAWRIHTMVDFLFGRAVVLRSSAENHDLARTIDAVLHALIEANGGIALLQELALFGGIFGYADLVLRVPPGWPASPAQGGQNPTREDRSKINVDRATRLARTLRLETVEASRVLPILAEDDYRTCRLWCQQFFLPARPASIKAHWLRRKTRSAERTEVIELLSPTRWQRYENRTLVAQGPNRLGRLPVVHVQNLPDPGRYAGLSDVEPLIPLQDELNTRLSDRAHRVTYQAFKMYLGKGIDDFLERPVGPGQMWATQNLQASIEEFGRDEGSPSEDAHIQQIRAALDKTSGVTPLAAGIVRDQIGHLTSSAALKVVLAGLLAKTARKRLTYATGLAHLADLVLDLLDRTGVLHTDPTDRRINVHWPDPLPEDETEALRRAQIKQQLGVPAEQLLAELGYETPNPQQG